MVWRHGKNTQFRVLRQEAKWTKWRWSVIFCCFLTLSICFFLRGQQSNLDKLDKIAKVNTGRGLVMFLSLSFSFPQTLFCLVNPLPGFSVTVKMSPSGLSGGRAVLCVWLNCHPMSQHKLHSFAPDRTWTATKPHCISYTFKHLSCHTSDFQWTDVQIATHYKYFGLFGQIWKMYKCKLVLSKFDRVTFLLLSQ